MAGLVPAIHVFLAVRPQDVDARDERGHDESEAVNAKGADGTRVNE
jgi:hypothetical protein